MRIRLPGKLVHINIINPGFIFLSLVFAVNMTMGKPFFKSAGVGYEAEPNDSWEEATTVDQEVSFLGRIDNFGDSTDYIRYTPPPNAIEVKIEIQNPREGTSGFTSDYIQYHIYNTANNQVFSRSSKYLPPDEDFNIKYRSYYTGDIKIKLSKAAQGGNVSYGINWEFEYKIVFSAILPSSSENSTELSTFPLNGWTWMETYPWVYNEPSDTWFWIIPINNENWIYNATTEEWSVLGE